MKKTILFALLLMPFFGISQDSTVVNGDIEVRTYTDGNKILLRWIPLDDATWKKGNEFGYKIERIATHFNDSLLTFTEVMNSKTTLFYNLRPYSPELFDELFDDDSTYAHIAKMVLYEPNPPISNPSSPTLADAVETQENNAIRHLFGIFAADQNFDIARYMALGYEDPCIEGPSYRYQYFVTLSNPDDSTDVVRGYSDQVSLRDTTRFPSPFLNATSGVHQCDLQWNPIEYEQFYTSYDVERSDNGVDFYQINEYPYVQLVNDGERPGWATFNDSLDIDETAYYRVRGRTPFGISGPVSNVDTATGLWPRLPIYVNVDTAEFTVSDTQATIYWNSFDNNWTDTLEGFNIYISREAQFGYRPLEQVLLPPSTRSYTLPATQLNQYVKLEATDINGYTYYSMAFLVQPEDHTPPVAPIGLTGKYIMERRIELTWEENTEIDLKGYRVFVGNERGKTFVELTKQAIDIPIYYHDVKAEMEIDSIYFKIVATDQHSNYSEYSEILSMPRPDITPPSSANLFRVYGGIHGIELAWRFSSSDDRVKHILQRRMLGTPVWVNVVEIPIDDEDNFIANILPTGDSETNFVDTAKLNIQEYEYRMMAIDDSDNISYSQRKTVVPYDPGVRGEIENLTTYFEIYHDPSPDSVAFDAAAQVLTNYQTLDTITTEDLDALVQSDAITPSERDSLSALPSQGIYAYLIAQVQLRWHDITNVRIILSWDYGKMHSLKKFHILRSLNTSGLAPYDIVDAVLLPQHIYIDTDVEFGWQCDFQVYALHGDGGFSPLSEEISITIPTF